MGRLDDKVALISGGASGIGAATARRFADEGAQVVVADIDEAGGAAVAEAINEANGGRSAAFQRLDVTEADGWAAAVGLAEERFGRLDVLVNAAGILFAGTVEDTSLEDWRRMLAVNLDGTWLGCRAAVPAMRRAGGGSIVNLSSVAGLRGQAYLCAYNASKGAVRVLTKAVADNLARGGDSIRCNSVHPGVIETPMVEGFLAKNEALRRAWSEPEPVGRHGSAAEIAGMIVLLASDESGFVTGAEYVIDGGMTA